MPIEYPVQGREFAWKSLVTLAAAITITTILVCRPWVLKAEVIPTTRVDLRKYGYLLTGSNINVLDFSSVAFFSENLVAVAINQQVPDNPYVGGALGSADRSNATLIAVELSSSRITGPVHIPILKNKESISAVIGGRLAVITAKGVRICDSSFGCVSPGISELPPLLVSPRGKVIAVGGYGRTATKIFDAVTLRQLSAYEYRVADGLQTVSPGDKAVLVSQGGRVSVRDLDGNRAFEIPAAGIIWHSVRFLDFSYVGALDSDRKRAMIFGLDGSHKYDYRIERAERSHFLTCLDGGRFGIYEQGYTFLNTMENLLDIENIRPENFARVRIFELASGVEKASIEWDPLSRSTDPALSPNGSKIARIRGGYLEVVTID